MLSYFFLALLLPTLALTNQCPAFQAVIPLRERATAQNWTYAVVADGKYFLLKSRELPMNGQDKDSQPVDQSGSMPPEFETDSLSTVVDGSDCDDQYYYLITIKSFDMHPIQTKYSTLDLINWTESSRWSEPKTISENLMLSQDKTLMAMIRYNLIQDKVKTLVHWNAAKALFLVSEPYTSGVYSYHVIDTKGICNQTYTFYPETDVLSLNESLSGLLIGPLDLCYFQKTQLMQVLYCFSNLSLQASLVTSDPHQKPFNSPLTTLAIIPTANNPETTVDRLRDIGRLCRKSDDTDLLKSLINEDYADDDIGKMGTPPSSGLDQIIPKIPKLTDELQPKADDADNDSDGVSYTVIIVVVCVILMVLLIAAIGLTATRKNNQLARM